MILQETLRVDILNTVCTRLLQYAALQSNLTNLQLENIKSFIQLSFLPNDIRLAFAQDLITSDHPQLKMLVSDPVIGKILLEGV